MVENMHPPYYLCVYAKNVPVSNTTYAITDSITVYSLAINH